MKHVLNLVLLLVGLQSGWSQGVNIVVDLKGPQRKISPYIYGRNAEFSDAPDAPTSAATFRKYQEAGIRFGRQNAGNNCTKYNWKRKLTSHPDWYNNVYAHDWDYAARSIIDNMPGIQLMFGFQLTGWAAANRQNNFNDWAYNQSKYWQGVGQNLAGGGIPNPSGNKALSEGDPTKYLMPWPADSTTAILDHWFGEDGLGLPKNQLTYWNMDNEIEIWNGTHDDIMPTQIPATDFMENYFKVAKLARAKFPEIKIVGPVPANEWQWFKYADETLKIDGRYYSWLEYFIKRVADEQLKSGVRLLDVLDIHAYLSDAKPEDLVQLHRVFFDTEYAYPGANGLRTINGGWETQLNKEYILKRVRDWLDLHMGPNHGVGIGVSESGFNDANPNLTAVLYASTLGTFAQEGVEFYTPWSWNIGQWEVLHLFSRYAQSMSIETHSDDNTFLSAYGSTNFAADSVCLILVNREQTRSRLTSIRVDNFKLPDGYYPSLQLSQLPSTETFQSHQDNALKSSKVVMNANSISITLPPLSVTAVFLSANQAQAITGVESQPLEMDRIPNPIHTETTLTFLNRSMELLDIQLFTGDGKLIKKYPSQRAEQGTIVIAPDNLSDGTYILKIRSNSCVLTEKIMIQKN